MVCSHSRAGVALGALPPDRRTAGKRIRVVQVAFTVPAGSIAPLVECDAMILPGAMNSRTNLDACADPTGHSFYALEILDRIRPAAPQDRPNP
jgi:hypothetical protein